MKLYSPTTIRGIKEKYGFKLSKSLGQNFLTDKNIIDKIIDESYITDEDLVIEIGPGIGVLTSEAAQVAKQVVAIEVDNNLIPILKDTLRDFNNIDVINMDVLKTDLNEIISRYDCKGVKIIGNLPYYITTPIIMKILEDGVKADSITIMMQKEVADRIKSKPSVKAYGALSVAVQYYCEVVDVARVPKEVFVPQPKVDSSVLRLDLRKECPVDLLDKDAFFACVKAAFGQRRKTLNNALMSMPGVDKEVIKEALASSEIDGIRRGETLSLDEFALLANEIYKRG